MLSFCCRYVGFVPDPPPGNRKSLVHERHARYRPVASWPSNTQARDGELLEEGDATALASIPSPLPLHRFLIHLVFQLGVLMLSGRKPTRYKRPDDLQRSRRAYRGACLAFFLISHWSDRGDCRRPRDLPAKIQPGGSDKTSLSKTLISEQPEALKTFEASKKPEKPYSRCKAATKWFLRRPYGLVSLPGVMATKAVGESPAALPVLPYNRTLEMRSV